MASAESRKIVNKNVSSAHHLQRNRQTGRGTMSVWINEWVSEWMNESLSYPMKEWVYKSMAGCETTVIEACSDDITYSAYVSARIPCSAGISFPLNSCRAIRWNPPRIVQQRVKSIDYMSPNTDNSLSVSLLPYHLPRRTISAAAARCSRCYIALMAAAATAGFISTRQQQETVHRTS